MQPSQHEDQGIGQELKHDTKTIGSAAANRLHSEVDSRKDDSISQIQEVSSALKKTADELGANAPDWLKSVLVQGAEQITKFAKTLEQKDSRQMTTEVRSFAQQSPGTFLAACAAAGFAASRIFKAGENDSQSGTGDIVSYDSDFPLSTNAQPAPAYPSMQS